MAATIKQRARGLLRAAREVLADKALPKTLRGQIEALSAALQKTWAELAKDAEVDEAGTEEVREPATMGAWLESRIHSIFTQIADDMYGDGRLTRAERKGLSHAIGMALDAFIEAVVETCPQVYQRRPWDEAPEIDGTADVQEAVLQEAAVPLLERAVRGDGSIALKIIQPGEGSSGFYPPEVLERDGPKVFSKGVKMYWNHPTPTEEAERPERDLRDLAAELLSDARWVGDHPQGPGLYAEAKVFEPYQDPVNDLAEHIGVSIRAVGRATPGTVNGKAMPIIQEITAAKSVDFVTTPGAGGQILTLFEAARGSRAATSPLMEGAMTKEEEEALRAKVKQLESENEALKKQVKDADEAKEAATTEAARIREAKALTDASSVLFTELGTLDLPEPTRKRLVESLKNGLPLKEDGTLDVEALQKRAQEAAKTELAYLAEATGVGTIQGMGTGGGANNGDQAQIESRLAQAFQGMGLSESASKTAAKGR